MSRKVIVIVKSVLRQAHEVLSVILLERIGVTTRGCLDELAVEQLVALDFLG